MLTKLWNDLENALGTPYYDDPTERLGGMLLYSMYNPNTAHRYIYPCLAFTDKYPVQRC